MTAVPDWNDPDMRRRLCTALCELLHQYGPEGEGIVDLAERTSSLTPHELAAIKAYFGTSRASGPVSA